MARSTWHYRQRPRDRVAVPIRQKDRAYRSRISEDDRSTMCERILTGWKSGVSVDQAFALGWDEGVMLAACPARWLTDQRKDTRRVDHRQSQAALVRSSESTLDPTGTD